MEWLSAEIESCLRYNLRYAALSLAFTIPDICAKASGYNGTPGISVTVHFSPSSPFGISVTGHFPPSSPLR
jgi:hypothetical protein